MKASHCIQLAKQAETNAIHAFHLWAVLPFKHPLAAGLLRLKDQWYAIAAAWRAQARPETVPHGT